jgi:hypothetical protein
MMSKVDYRSLAFEHKPAECELCKSQRRWKLDVHHKDGDQSNNELENLMMLCKTCHGRIHTQCPGYEKWTNKLPKESCYGVQPKQDGNMLEERINEVEDREPEYPVNKKSKRKPSTSSGGRVTLKINDPDEYRSDVSVDDRGRVTIGKQFANQRVNVAVEVVDDE